MTSILNAFPPDVKRLIIDLFSFRDILDHWEVFEEYMYNETIDTIFTRYNYKDLKYLAPSPEKIQQNAVYFADTLLRIDEDIPQERDSMYIKLSPSQKDRYIKIMRNIIQKHVIDYTKMRRIQNTHGNKKLLWNRIKVIINLKSIYCLNNETLNPIQIILDKKSNFDIQPGIINQKNSIKWIEFGQCYKKLLIVNSLPKSITHVKFGPRIQSRFNTNLLFPNLIKLQLPDHYDHPLEPGDLPESLKYLIINEVYKQPLKPGTLPNGLKYLKLNYYIPPIIKESYPQHLYVLDISRCRWKIEPNVLPIHLHELRLGNYEHKLELDSLPKFLKILKFDGYRQVLDVGVLPNTLETLSFNYDTPTLELGVLPESLITLKLGSYFDHPLIPNVLPSSLKYLYISKVGWGQYSHPILPKSLPDGLIKLNINNPNCHSYILCTHYNCFPTTLTSLKICRVTHIHPNTLPSSLKKLSLHNYQSKLIPGVLPEGLEILKIYYYNLPIDLGVLPKSLKVLDLHDFNEPFHKNVLPDGLIKLKLGGFNRQLEPNVIPNTVEELDLGNGVYKHPLGRGVLPKSIKKLVL